MTEAMTEIVLLGHSSVLLRDGERALLIDPGSFSDRDALRTAQAVLVTHAHPDHLAAEDVAASARPVWGPADALALLAQAGVPEDLLHPLAPGAHVQIVGFDVRVLGGEHAEVFPGVPLPSNNAYLVDSTVLHPGDSLPDLPDGVALDVLLLPVAAPWLRLADAIEYARATPAAQVVPIHDAILSDVGTRLVDSVVTNLVGSRYHRPPDGVVRPA